MLTARRDRTSGERGQVIVLFALLLPVFLGLGAIVIGLGNWYTHAKHLQTKADASVFAGGSAWAFPCGPQTDATIELQARTYVGSHIKADGIPFTATTLNPQVGGVPGSNIHTVLNGSAFYDNDSNQFPIERNDPVNPSLCDARILDVKATEDDSFPLFSLVPIFPDIKRKARVEIQESLANTGLLPIAVRVPKPVSAAAIFYNETPGPNYGSILRVKYLCDSPTLAGVPTGLGGWTTVDPANTQGPNNTSMCPLSAWANVAVPEAAGVAIALSFRPMCGAAGAQNPCFDITNPTTVNQMCDRTSGSGVAIAQCFYATGGGASQTVQSGLQFIRGYAAGSPGANQPPEVKSVWLSGSSGTNCGAYFGAPVVNACSATLNANVLTGNAMPSTDIEVRYKLVHGDTSDNGTGSCGNNYQPACDLSPGWSTSVTFQPDWVRSAIAIRVRLKNTTVAGFPTCNNNSYNANCSWYFTSAGRSTSVPNTATIFANPLQRNFMGDIDLSGSVKWLNLWADLGCDGFGAGDFGIGETGQAASVPTGARCFKLDVGLQGAISKDQDEYPIAFNVSTTSQHQLLDCDPNIPQGQIDDAIAQGCGPWYKAHEFIQAPLCPNQNSIFNLPQPAPWQDWDPKTCTKTRPTASGNQLQQGFNQRFFQDKTNPACPADVAGQPGRNYWNDANNQNDTVTKTDANGNSITYQTTYTELGPSGAHGNFIPEGDPRLVTLFFTPYDSFGGSGQATYPIVGLGRFYITGYGRAGGIDDPCSGGNTSGIVGAGSLPPPDLNFGNNYFVWGHFVKDVVLSGSSTPSGTLCDPLALNPCVPVLVE